MYGLEKRLSRIDEVESVSTNAAEGIVLIQPMSGELIDLDELNDAVDSRSSKLGRAMLWTSVGLYTASLAVTYLFLPILMFFDT